MEFEQLKKLIKTGESETLEFKTSTGSISSAMQTICAFLNSAHGGKVIFGVTDSGQIIGQLVSDKTRKDIAIEIAKIEPHAPISVIYLSLEENKFVIVISAESGDKAPYTYDGRSFVRYQSVTTRMNRDEYGDLHHQTNPTIWESLTNNECNIDDLDTNRIKEVVRMGVFSKRLPESAISESIPDILMRLKLLVHGKLTNAAVILFCKDEHKQFFQSMMRLARFQGVTKTIFLDNKQFTGNAFDLYDKAMDFLHFCLPVAARIEEGNPIRIETPAIPYKVLREALANALVHRDYSNSGGSVSVAIYDDRVNIMNYGSLLKGVKLQQLSREHASTLRNPLIANVFYVCGKIEKWGRGTLDMIEDCQKIGNPIPKYEDLGTTFSVTFPLKEPIRTIENIAQSVSWKERSDLTLRQKEILNLLEQGPLNRNAITAKMSIVLTGRTIQRELNILKDMGLVRSEGQTNATIWYLELV